MSGIPSAMSRAVRERALHRCEYCGLSQVGQEATFHVDHIIPQIEGGATQLANLALACVLCSLHKAARVSAIDSETGDATAVFHPRRQSWREHFRVEDGVVVGMSATGRARVQALQKNRRHRVEIRQIATLLGRYPPPESWPTT